jgi:hypothetical protein
MVTVPRLEAPPTTLTGETVKLMMLGGKTVKVADFEAPYSVPVIVTPVDTFTVEVVAVNVAVRAPAATVALEGTFTIELPEESATAVPPLGAATERVTVPVEVVPPVTAVGFIVTLARDVGFSVSPVVTSEPLQVAVTLAEVTVETDSVLMLKLATVPPAGTVFWLGGIT